MATERTRRVTRGDLSDVSLVALSFSAGAVDAISYLGLGRVFTANMTGNIVLLGVAAGQGTRSGVVRSAIAFVTFAAAVYLAVVIASRPSSSAGWPTGVRVVLAGEALVQTALLAGWLAAAGRPGVTLEAVLTGASGTAMGLQSGAVMALGIRGISTTYVTGTLTGLLGGLATRTGSRRDWTRRASIVAAILVGAACAGLLVLHARRAAPALPLAGTLLVLGVAAFAMPSARGA